MSEKRQNDRENQQRQTEEDGLPGVEFNSSILVVRGEDEENDTGYEPECVTKSAGCILTQAAGSRCIRPSRRRVAGPRTSYGRPAIRTKGSRSLASTIRTKCHRFSMRGGKPRFQKSLS